MRAVSIEDFIDIIYGEDSCPPSAATIRRQCTQKSSDGKPLIPGAYKAGKPWKIDLDVYIPEMQLRINGNVAQDQEQEWADKVAMRLVAG